jgi:hypothetical protein
MLAYIAAEESNLYTFDKLSGNCTVYEDVGQPPPAGLIISAAGTQVPSPPKLYYDRKFSR